MPITPSTTREIVFDFDGTLADSFGATLRIANRLAPVFGYRAVQDSEVDYLRGRSYREVAAHVGMAWHKVPMIAHRIRQEVAATVPSMGMIAGLPPVLSELAARYTLGILTSNSQENVERFLQTHGLTQFAFISSTSDLWGKGRTLKAQMKKRSLRPGEMVYVGDEVRDIEACKAAAVPIIAVGWGYTAPALLSSLGPDHMIQEPQELLAVMGAA